jgi:hypothetical protein
VSCFALRPLDHVDHGRLIALRSETVGAGTASGDIDLTRACPRQVNVPMALAGTAPCRALRAKVDAAEPRLLVPALPDVAESGGGTGVNRHDKQVDQQPSGMHEIGSRYRAVRSPPTPCGTGAASAAPGPPISTPGRLGRTLGRVLRQPHARGAAGRGASTLSSKPKSLPPTGVRSTDESQVVRPRAGTR